MAERSGRTPFHLSLQAKMLAIVLVCVLGPLLAAGGYFYDRSQVVLKQKVQDGLLNQLFRKSGEVDEWFRERLSDAGRWAASFVVYEGVEALGHPGANGPRVERELEEYLQSVLGNYRSYESLFIVDPSGKVVASTRGEELEPWARRLIAQGLSRGIVTPLQWSDVVQHSTQLVLQPIQGRTGATVGYLAERLDLRELERRLGTPVDTEAALLRDVGDLEASLSGEGADELPSFWLLDLQGTTLAKAGRILNHPEPFPGALPPPTTSVGGVSEAPFPGLGVTVYGMRRLEGPTGGFLAATLARSRAYRSLTDARAKLLKLGIPAILLILLVCFSAARGMLRPILLLSEGAKRVSAGDLNVFLPVWGRDEIADLTRAFNEMARRLREGRQSLEEARDELARTNEGLKAANRTLETLAITDGLTGLYNHRHFQDTLEKEIRRCDREGKHLSVLLLDLDHFKQYNDRFGHTEGDAALRRVAGQVMKSIRSTDMAFRYGGEELAVLLPSCPKSQAAEVADKIRVAVRTSAHRPGRFGGRTTLSVGVATFPEDGRVSRGLVDFADAALYAAKAQGRDRVALAGTGPVKTETAG